MLHDKRRRQQQAFGELAGSPAPTAPPTARIAWVSELGACRVRLGDALDAAAKSTVFAAMIDGATVPSPAKEPA